MKKEACLVQQNFDISDLINFKICMIFAMQGEIPFN